MKSNKKTIRKRVWFYLTVFSISILSFLWIFQVIFLGAYYEIVERNEVENVTNKIKRAYGTNNFESTLDRLSYSNNVCIEISNSSLQSYSVNQYFRGCSGILNNIALTKFKQNFITNNLKNSNFVIKDSNYGGKILIKAISLDDDNYAFVSAILAPIGSTTTILASQLIYVTLLVLLLSFVIAYFISEKISDPIVSISKTAASLGKGNYDVTFEVNNTTKEIEDLAQTLNHAKDTLSKTDAIRRELLANVSHDLKTPLTMIKAYAEMTRDLNGENKEKRDQNCTTIIEETDRLTLLVNDILELSKMQSGNETLKMENFDIHEMIKEVLNKFDYLDDINFIYKNEKSYIVKGDKKRIYQVLFNLINNAIHYVGKDRQVIIQVSVIKKDKVLVEVKDHGKGIKKEEQEYIWDKYYQVNKQYSRTGTGIGLSIVKSILELHKVKYGVESKKGEGTTFYFELKKQKTSGLKK